MLCNPLWFPSFIFSICLFSPLSLLCVSTSRRCPSTGFLAGLLASLLTGYVAGLTNCTPSSQRWRQYLAQYIPCREYISLNIGQLNQCHTLLNPRTHNSILNCWWSSTHLSFWQDPICLDVIDKCRRPTELLRWQQCQLQWCSNPMLQECSNPCSMRCLIAPVFVVPYLVEQGRGGTGAEGMLRLVS